MNCVTRGSAKNNFANAFLGVGIENGRAHFLVSRYKKLMVVEDSERVGKRNAETNILSFVHFSGGAREKVKRNYTRQRILGV